MNLTKLSRVLLDLIEIQLPAIAFLTMFSAFLVEIVARYVFNFPLVWTYEISTLLYTWTILLGACLASRRRTHIVFDLAVESLSTRNKLWVEIGGNASIIVLFILALYPSWDFIQFSKVSKSPMLLIPMSIGFFPFLVFLVLSIGHLAFDTYRAARQLLRAPSTRPLST